MSSEALSGEQLKEHATKQALAGDYVGARQTASRISDTENLRQAWQNILFVAAECRDVYAVKETIGACPDEKLFYCHAYRDLPHTFIKAGDMDGAIEVARTMGDLGSWGLMGIAFYLAQRGDLVRAKEVLSFVHQDLATLVMPMLDECYSKAMAQQNIRQSGR